MLSIENRVHRLMIPDGKGSGTGVAKMEERAAALRKGETIPALVSSLGSERYDPLEDGGVTPVVTPDGQYLVKDRYGNVMDLRQYLR